MTPITPQTRPTRWPWLAAAQDGGQLWLYDPRRIASPVVVSQAELEAIQLFTGRFTIQEIHAALSNKLGASSPSVAALVELVTKLDRGLFLDGPAFRAYLASPVRRPSCIGCYPPDPADIHAQLDGLFTGPGGPGPVGERRTDGPRLRAVLVPHMDFARGNVTYGWGFKELAERTDARLFVVIATSHYSPARFTLTRMNFATPLGTVETDQAYVDRLVQSYGDGLFDDPLAHLPEHSIELEVVVLQHLFADRPFRIVPLLVGSFGDCVSSLTPPGRVDSIQRMVEALQQAEAAAGEPVCYVISGDLAHIGPKFDDPDPVREPLLGESRKQDGTILEKLATADRDGYFDVIAAEGDARRICGLPPTWLTLAAAKPTAGRVLHYQQFVHPDGFESVSFAAAAFYE